MLAEGTGKLKLLSCYLTSMCSVLAGFSDSVPAFYHSFPHSNQRDLFKNVILQLKILEWISIVLVIKYGVLIINWLLLSPLQLHLPLLSLLRFQPHFFSCFWSSPGSSCQVHPILGPLYLLFPHPRSLCVWLSFKV